MKKEVSPIIAVLGILAALTLVQVLYWRGLWGGAVLDMAGASGGGGGHSDSASMPAGLSDVIVTTVAGGGGAGHQDGAAASALFDGPVAIAVAESGAIYVADSRNHCIRTVSSVGEAATLAGGFFDMPIGWAGAIGGCAFLATLLGQNSYHVTRRGEMERKMAPRFPTRGSSG